jgi:hypothetical protein
MVGPYRVHRPAVIRDDTIPIKLFASRLGLLAALRLDRPRYAYSCRS